MTVVLQYNKDMGVFFFEGYDSSISKIFGIKRVWLNADKSVWTLPSSYPQGIVSLKDFKAIFPESKATNEAIAMVQQLKAIQNGIPEHTLITSSNYEFPKKYPPYIHQLNTIEVMLHNNTCAILLDMGLGKTYIVLIYLMICKMLGQSIKALILCPKIMRLNWKWESEKFTPELTCIVYEGTPKQKERLQNEIEETEPNLVVTNYEALGQVNSEKFNFFKNLPWSHLVIDEASRIKGYNSNRSLSILQLSKNIEKKYLLSGGLTLGNPTDLWMPYNVLDPSILGPNWWSFKNKYCRFSKYNKHIISGYKNLDILKNKIEPFSVILDKKDCLTLPEQNVITQYIPMTTHQWELYTDIISNDIVTIKDRIIPVDLAIVKINKLLQIISGFINFPPNRELLKCNKCEMVRTCVMEHIFPWQETKCKYFDPSIPKPKIEYYDLFSGTEFQPKLQVLREIVETIQERKEHLIVWAYYRFDFNEIKETLKLDGTTFVTSDEPGSDIVFQKGKHTVYLGQISTGIGTTLTKATTMVYYSHSLKLEDRLQSMERNYRISQHNNVTVIDFVTKGTIEEQVLELLHQKRDVRDFIHSKTECRKCDKFGWCFERLIEPYSKDCKLYNIRTEAEKVKHINIKEKP